MRLIDADRINFYKVNLRRGVLGFDDVEIVEKEQIDRMPTIDPESLRPHAAWINIHDGNFICSCCKNPVGVLDMMNHPLMIGYSYCPYCGAKMDGGENA